MKACFVYLIDLLVLVGAAVLGIFGPVGLCAGIWGPDIINTALGNPPIRSHPAFILFIVLIAPSMIISAVGAVFCIILPLHIQTKVPFSSRDKALGEALRRYLGKIQYKEKKN